MTLDHTTTITQYIVDEFVPDVRLADLAADYDLFAGGVIDSLALLKVLDWLGDRFQLNLDDVELSPDNFRTIHNINAFIGVAGAQQK
jgi:acyl carrier protein